MKKITLLMLFLSTLWGYSQVKNYTFTKTIGTYSEITGGTVLGNETTDAQLFVDPAYPLGNGLVNFGAGFPIGFNFTFNGYVYNRFAVAADGWISLGNSAITPYAVNANVTSIPAPLSSLSDAAPEVLQAKIAALGKDLMAQSGSSISYKTIGTSPNRILVVQWKKYMKGGTVGAGDDFNFQIRLNETANTVDIVYGSFVSNVMGGAQNYQVGLRAEPALVASNFVNRKSTAGWGNTIDGTTVTDAVLMNDLLIPSNGLTFTWTPPTCGGAKGLVVSSLTTNSAQLNWSSYTPLPSSYEYFISTSSTLPVSTFSGTAITNPTLNLSTLTSNTTYNVFLRSKCDSSFTPWILGGTFKTLCPDAVSVYEDFDLYDATTTGVMPDCWFKTGTTGRAYISNVSVVPGVINNKLYLSAYAPGQNSTASYGVIPTLTNLQDGTNRLRFTAHCINSGTIKLDVGYFTDSSNAGSFVLIKTVTVPGNTPDKAIQFIVTPDVIPNGVKNLVFRNKPTTAPADIYIDNVVWEPTPYCGDVSGLTGKGLTSSSIDMSWTAGSYEGAWQYVYGPATVTNPNTLTPVEVYYNTTTIGNLNSATSYKVWVRSACDPAILGAWIGPYIFSTACAPTSQFMENFDSSTSLLPSCWKKVGTTGSVFASSSPDTAPPSLPTVLALNGSPTQGPAVVVLPPVSNATSATNKLKFKMNVTVPNSTLEIGYLTDITDPSTFVVLETITSSSQHSYDSYVKAYGSDPKSNYLAFRNPGLISSIINIDDIVWETISTCADVSAFATTEVTSTTASLSWNVGANESAWQYVIGPSSLKDPFSSTPVNVTSSSTSKSTTISNLTPVTTYKVWMRSKCSATSFGSWVGPVAFKTSCPSGTDFSESFDNSTAMPACWSKVGTLGTVTVLGTTSTPSAPNILSISGSLNNGAGVCAMPPVSNAGAGTYRLKFKSRSSTVNCVLEVGYLTNFSNASSFAPLWSYQATQTATYDFQSIELGLDPSTDILVFRVTGNPIVGTFYIDDVIWEPIPGCADIKNLAMTGIKSTSVDISWTAGGSETKWQYAIGSASLANPNTLSPVDVTSKTLTISDLTSLTSYKVWVRAKCTSTSYGTWVGPIIFTTNCTAVDSFSENFDSNLNMPSCWIKVGSGGYAYVSDLSITPKAPPLMPTTTKPNALTLYSQLTNSLAVVAMPPVTNPGAGDHVLNFKYNASLVNCVLEVGYITNISDAGSFVPFKTIPISSINDFKTAIVDLGSSPLSNVLAFRHTGTVQGYIFIDNVSWDLIPHNVPACATAVGATPNANCGNFNTTISWNPVTGADGYKLTVGTTSGGSDILNEQLVGVTTYSVASVPNKTYYYTVKPFNSVGTTSGCAEQGYTSNPNTCYCTSVPKGVDGKGVTKVVIGGSSFTAGNLSSPTYYDFTSKPVNLAKGQDSFMQITFETNNYFYDIAVYIDINDNFIFENSEIFYTGMSANVTPNTVPVPFTILDTVALGKHRMRISSNNTGYSVDSCNNGQHGITLDFTVNVVTAVANDLLSGAIPLTVGTEFDQNAVTGNNINATGSYQEPTPGCGGYNGADVWYKAVVPVSGNLTFEINSAAGGIINTAAAAYSGSADSLTLIKCDDSSSTAGDDQPKINLQRPAGETIYFRIWENGGDAYGLFKVSAYGPLLSATSYDEINFSYYPNPVKDILNLSFVQDIDNVTIMNLLGQQMVSKSLKANQGRIDISHLSSGTYLVKVNAGNQVKTIKIVKE